MTRHSATTWFLERDWAWVALLVVVCFYVSSFWYWHSLDTSPVEIDQSVYYSRATQFFGQLSRADIASITRDLETGTDARLQPLRPLLVPLLTGATYLVAGDSRSSALLTPLLSGILLLLFCFLIGKEWLNAKAGALAAFVTITLPLVSIISRQYYLELPQAAVCAATVYLLVRRDAFNNPITAVGIGAVAGIGMLVRETYPLFVAGPFAASLVGALLARRGKGGYLRVVGGAVIAGVLAISLAVPFFLPKLAKAMRYLPNVYGSARSAQYHGIESVSRLDLAAAYTYAFGQFGVSIAYLLLFVVVALVLVVLVVKARGRPFSSHSVVGAAVVGAWIVVPFAVSCTSYANDLRYVTPALPAFAILLSGLILSVPWPRWRTAIVGLAVVIGLAQFYAVGFAGDQPRFNFIYSVDEIASQYPGPGSGAVNVKSYMAQLADVATPRREDWKINEILAAIDNRRKQAGKRSATVFLVPWQTGFNPSNFITSASLLKYPLKIRGVGNQTVPKLIAAATSSDYLIVKGKPFGAADVQAVMDALPTLPFKPTDDRFSLPDGSEVVIYERTAP
ncbi:MAG: glycosyltransferase family 39 protein [Chloroflexi bacterium]|nr:glycosyltransferase family 39 protein [Chloroflexota bacterium]